MLTSSLPLVRLDLLDAAGARREELARAVDEACRRMGFLLVRGHGVPEAVQAAAWSAAQHFFERPLAEKLRTQSDDASHPYGYSPLAGETLSRSAGREAPADLKESYSVAPPYRQEAATAGLRTGPSLWPSAPPAFEAALSAYYREMEKLAARLMALFAIALELPEDFFQARIDRHVSALRAIHYPGLTKAPPAGQLRAGAHTDYGSLTILKMGPDQPGLEIQSPEGRWVAVPEVPGGFVVNLGDLMARWTNDRWRSTLHRVSVPAARLAAPRHALAFFHQPNWDAEVAALPSCTSRDNPARHAPVQSGPWLREKLRRAYRLA